MSTILFIGVLIAITYALTSSSSKNKPTKKTGPRRPESPGPFSEDPMIDKGSMLRCHNCGVFFAESRAVRSQVHDLELHFCSKNCQTNFRVD